MTASPVKFTAGSPGHDYTVTRRADGAKLGQVSKRSTHYNLARPVTVHYWIAENADGESLRGSDNQSTKFSTRTEAAEALLAAKIADEQTEEVVLHLNPTDAITLTRTPERGIEVRVTGTDVKLGRVYESYDLLGKWIALGTDGHTLSTEDGVSIAWPTHRAAAAALFDAARAEDEADEAEYEDACDECGEPRDLGDDGELLPCATCAEAIRPVHLMSDDLLPACGSTGDASGVSVAPWTTPERITCSACRPLIEPAREADYAAQEAETARIEELCSVAAKAHEVAMNTKGRGKGAAFAARADALDALREAALPEEATNVDALDLALGGTTVEAIENRYLALRGERLADELSEGAVVRFRPGVMPSCEGVNFLVEGELLYDNSRGGRPYVWLRDDSEGTRSAYLDALVLVTPAEATL